MESPPLTAEQHIDKAERLLSLCDNATTDGMVGFALRATAHLKMAALLMGVRERVL